MGEDIHQKTFVKSKITGKYVNAVELIGTQKFKYSPFEELIPDRFYDLYSCFGSRRGDWKALNCLKYGLPDWFAEQFPTEKAVHDKMKNSYYGYCWCTLSELKADLEEYIVKLEDPAKYFTDNDDEYERERFNDPANAEFFTDWTNNAASIDWTNDAANIRSYMKEMLNKIETTILFGDEDWMKDIFDPDDVVFLFWFDN